MDQPAMHSLQEEVLDLWLDRVAHHCLHLPLKEYIAKKLQQVSGTSKDKPYEKLMHWIQSSTSTILDSSNQHCHETGTLEHNTNGSTRLDRWLERIRNSRNCNDANQTKPRTESKLARWLKRVQEARSSYAIENQSNSKDNKAKDSLMYIRNVIDGNEYCGYSKGTLREFQGSIRSDLFEYHGNFKNGKMYGGAKYFSKKGFRFTGHFKDGNPHGVGFLDDDDGTRWKVEYDGKVSFEEGATPLKKEEVSHKPYVPGKVNCLACKKVILNALPTREAQDEDSYAHIRNISARLVLARPPFADVPLWNADEVRGKIVAIMRGPKPPAEMVSFTTKLHHAQLAGAVAVVFVDNQNTDVFTSIPRVEEGPISSGVVPGGNPLVQVKIPAVMILQKDISLLQEGATHIIAFPPVQPGTNLGYRAGIVGCPRQESKFGISKNEADALMKEFFNARKHERLQEQSVNQQSPVQNPLQDPEASDNILADLNRRIMRRVIGKIEGIAGQQNWEWIRYRASAVIEPLIKQNDPETARHSINPRSDASQAGEQTTTGPSDKQVSSYRSQTNGEARESEVRSEHAVQQDTGNGYHVLVRYGLTFSGQLQNGLPHGFCEMKLPDGTEIHGFFVGGELTGQGKYYFTDGQVYEGSFICGLPTEGYLYNHIESKKYLVRYQDNMPLWDGAKPSTKEEVSKAFLDGKAQCVGLCIAKATSTNGEKRKHEAYKHLRNISGRLVWARPQFADMPLWNADQVAGKIVAVKRGPKPFAPPCNYSRKLHFCQKAGAIGLIVLDWDPSNKFTMIPKLEAGFQNDDSCIPLQIEIPCCMVLNQAEPLLQEGTMIKISFAPADYQYQPKGWRVGFVHCPKQESGSGLPTKQAEELMNEFLIARKEERSSEMRMIEKKTKNQNNFEQELGGKEWMDGNVFSSLIPVTEDEMDGTHSTRYEITKEIMSKITSPQKAAQIASDTDEYLKRIEAQFRGSYSKLNSKNVHEDTGNSPKADDGISPNHQPDVQIMDGIGAQAEMGHGLRSIVEIEQPSPQENSCKRDVGVQCEAQQNNFWDSILFQSIWSPAKRG